MYDLDEIGVTAVESVDQSRPDKGSSRIEGDDFAHAKEEVVGDEAADVGAEGMAHAAGAIHLQAVVAQISEDGGEAAGDRTHVGHCRGVAGSGAQSAPVDQEDVVAAVAEVGVS